MNYRPHGGWIDLGFCEGVGGGGGRNALSYSNFFFTNEHKRLTKCVKDVEYINKMKTTYWIILQYRGRA